MSGLRSSLNRWIWTVLGAVLTWVVLPTALAMAGEAPAPMLRGDMCSSAAPSGPASDGPAAPLHGSDCPLCVLSAAIGLPPEPSLTAPAPMAAPALSCGDGLAPQLPCANARRPWPQGPPASL